MFPTIAIPEGLSEEDSLLFKEISKHCWSEQLATLRFLEARRLRELRLSKPDSTYARRVREAGSLANQYLATWVQSYRPEGF